MSLLFSHVLAGLLKKNAHTLKKKKSELRPEEGTPPHVWAFFFFNSPAKTCQNNTDIMT